MRFDSSIVCACLLFAAHFFLKAFDERGHESVVSSVVAWLSSGAFMLAVAVTVRLQKATRQRP